MKKIIVATDKEHLQQLIEEEIDLNGNDCDLNHIDVSRVTDMSNMFSDSAFNGDISQWNTSNVTDMGAMFAGSRFNTDINKWDVINVKNMGVMFFNSQFNRDTSQWKPYKLEQCEYMFDNCPAIKPYWYREKAQEVVKVLKIYDSAQSLEQKLLTKPLTKKFKI